MSEVIESRSLKKEMAKMWLKDIGRRSLLNEDKGRGSLLNKQLILKEFL